MHLEKESVKLRLILRNLLFQILPLTSDIAANAKHEYKLDHCNEAREHGHRIQLRQFVPKRARCFRVSISQRSSCLTETFVAILTLIANHIIFNHNYLLPLNKNYK